MTGFSGAGAGTGITQSMNTGLQNVYDANKFGAKVPQGITNPTPQFGSVRGNLTAGGEQIGVNYPDYTKPIDSFAGARPGPKGYDVGVDGSLTENYRGSNRLGTEAPDFNRNSISSGNNFAKGENYKFIAQNEQMPVDGYSFSEKFDAVSNNPREFIKNLGDGNELYGAGKLGLTGIGLYASAMQPEDPYADYEMPGNEVRNRGPQGQLNLSNESSLNLNNPYGYAKGGGITTGKSLNVNNIKPNYTAGSLNVNTGSNTPPPPSVARAVPTSGTNVGGSSNKPFSVDTQFVMGQGTMPADAIMGGPNANYYTDIAGNYIRKAQGGMINDYAEGGYLSGGNVPGDGMSDSIPAMIGRGQQAALSEGEFVVPADVVSHLGNGSSNAGSKQLYAMMDQVRKDRTGTEKQGKQINPERYMPA